MTLQSRLQVKLSARFDELIKEGDEIYKAIKFTPAVNTQQRIAPAFYTVDAELFIAWRTKGSSLLAQVIPRNHFHFVQVQHFSIMGSSKEGLEWCRSFLQGIKDDFEKDFLGDVGMAIEAEIAADYMGQADHLLAEGQPGKFDHVPAAVLSGAVLEKALRTLCHNQQPPIPITTSSGNPKTLNPLIDDLKKTGVFNEAKAKQLRAWAAVRNHAAHGEFDQFARSDVEQMIQGITNFLAEYLK